MQADLISIIIPAYNSEKYIGRAIKSVIAQSYKNIEVIIIDDGSTDNTGIIAEDLAEKDKRIKVKHFSNSGESVSRNRGIKVALGQYIAFLDADDYMYPDMIEKMYRACVRNCSQVAVCSWRYVDEAGKELNWWNPKYETKEFSGKDAQRNFLETLMIEGFCWNKMFKRELYDGLDRWYDDRRVSFCDVVANFRLLGLADKVSYVGEPLVDYYQLDTSCTHTMDIRKDYDYLYTLVEVKEFSDRKGLAKSADIYSVNRMNKHLYGMMISKNQYDKDELKKYTIEACNFFEKEYIIKRLYYAIKYPIERWYKFGIKVLLVDIWRKNICKTVCW